MEAEIEFEYKNKDFLAALLLVIGYANGGEFKTPIAEYSFTLTEMLRASNGISLVKIIGAKERSPDIFQYSVAIQDGKSHHTVMNITAHSQFRVGDQFLLIDRDPGVLISRGATSVNIECHRGVPSAVQESRFDREWGVGEIMLVIGSDEDKLVFVPESTYEHAAATATQQMKFEGDLSVLKSVVSLYNSNGSYVPLRAALSDVCRIKGGKG